MRSIAEIRSEIPALQRQGLDLWQLACRLEELSMEGDDTRSIQVVTGFNGGKLTSVALRYLLEGEVIRLPSETA